jgi:glycosyltransferase involved in cell wall biosynthesis
MPIHAGVASADLRQALESVLAQTRVPEELVLVEDGPLNLEHETVLEEVRVRHPNVVSVVLDINSGAGIANQAGLEAASGDWIAKVDADDISMPNRFEQQLCVVQSYDLDLCGSAMLEFHGDVEQVVSVRRSPATHEAIGRKLRMNNPINHPTAFYRRSAALACGGYPAWRYMQDYGLVARMYSAGARMMNIREPLVLFRGGSAVTTRRRSKVIRDLEADLQRELQRLGVISWPRRCINRWWRTCYRLLPQAVVNLLSRHVLARRVTPGKTQFPRRS